MGATMRVRRQSNGQVLDFGASPALGFGSTGRVLAVPNEPSLVAKLYLRASPGRERKLTAMLQSQPAASSSVAFAWPLDLLYPLDGRDPAVGYLMPRARAAWPLADLCRAEVRRQEHACLTWETLLRVAANVAAAVHALHLAGHVIGDVNPANILVAEDAAVTLVDCDSFQVRDRRQGSIYRCPDGLPELTPPELQGQALSQVDRAPDHDLFGLAVLLFQLVMEGAHPFDGVTQAAGKGPTLEARIAAGHFPYGLKTATPYSLPPSALPFASLSPTLRDLFVRCFERGHTNPALRPDGGAWHHALIEAADALVVCPVDTRHRFGSHLGACPWCERAAGQTTRRYPQPLVFAPPSTQRTQPLVTEAGRASRLETSPAVVAAAGSEASLSHATKTRERGRRRWPSTAHAIGAGALLALLGALALPMLSRPYRVARSAPTRPQTAPLATMPSRSGPVSVPQVDRGSMDDRRPVPTGPLDTYQRPMQPNGAAVAVGPASTAAEPHGQRSRHPGPPHPVSKPKKLQPSGRHLPGDPSPTVRPRPVLARQSAPRPLPAAAPQVPRDVRAGRKPSPQRPAAVLGAQAPYRFPREAPPTLTYSGNVDGHLRAASAPVATAQQPEAATPSFESIRREESERRRQADAAYAAAAQREQERQQQSVGEFERVRQRERQRRQETDAAFARALEEERRERQHGAR